MRVYFKGGAWTNMEDQVLIDGVMKYGDRDWGKIASLVTRKSAENCQARWFEWLHPDIRKDDFTPEEDRRLLRLARAFPAMWRTIAEQMPGRTAGMCQDRHAELIEMTENGGALGEEFKERAQRESEWRPEARPARRDAVDNTKYETELLEESMARLANKKGKKALRRERERQLKDTQLRTQLQRSRELAAAGAMTMAQQGKLKPHGGQGGGGPQAVADVDGSDNEFAPVAFDEEWNSSGKRRVKQLEVISHLEKKRQRDEQEGTVGLQTTIQLSSTATPRTTAAAASTTAPSSRPAVEVGRLLPKALRQKAAEQAAPAVAGSSLSALLPAPKAPQAASAAFTAALPRPKHAATAQAPHATADLPTYDLVAKRLVAHDPPLPVPMSAPKAREPALDIAQQAVSAETRRMLRLETQLGLGASATAISKAAHTHHVALLDRSVLEAARAAIDSELKTSSSQDDLQARDAPFFHRVPFSPFALASQSDDPRGAAFFVESVRRAHEALTARRAELLKAANVNEAVQATVLAATQRHRHIAAASGLELQFYTAVAAAENEEIRRREAEIEARITAARVALAEMREGA